MEKQTNNTKIWYSLAFGWALFILFATIANTQTLVDLSLKSLFSYDKPIHAILFGVQTWLLIRALLSTPYKSYHTVVLISCVIVVFYGMLTELLQGWLTISRTFDYFDVLADGIGSAIAGVLLFKKTLLS